ncbi:MAG: ParB N-terminal domain-containing protein [Mesoflavibacter sp.]|nr:ParB N-terminal domain-containing protein [Mesoflavibacter sp.]
MTTDPGAPKPTSCHGRGPAEPSAGGEVCPTGQKESSDARSCEISVDELGEGLCGLRLCSPTAQRAIERSLMQIGQLTALLANEHNGSIEVIDGFKRLRAARSLGWSKLRVQVLCLEPVEAKLRMVLSNSGSGLCDLEQAWLIRSLYRDDNLSQPRIAKLFGRDKSWVSRRLLLAEGLTDELQADLRLGLISATAARELGRLPRGNQDELAQLVSQRGLTSRQCAKLVDDWLGARDEQARRQLLETAGQRSVAISQTARARPRTVAQEVIADIDQMVRCSARLQARLLERPLASHGSGEAEQITARLTELAGVLAAVSRTIGQVMSNEREQTDGQS